MGKTGWVTDSSPDHWSPGEVVDARWRPPSELALDVKYENALFSGTLRSANGIRFAGTLTERHSGDVVRASVDAYANDNELFFFGQWIESGTDYIWWVQLDRDELS